MTNQDKIPPFRKGTKLATLIESLSSDKGATLEELIKITAWQPHTVRAMLTNLKKHRNLNIESRKSDEGKRTYRFIGFAAKSVRQEATIHSP